MGKTEPGPFGQYLLKTAQFHSKKNGHHTNDQVKHRYKSSAAKPQPYEIAAASSLGLLKNSDAFNYDK